MANEIVQLEHVFVILEGYYYRMANVRKRRHRAEHQETKTTHTHIEFVLNNILLPKHRLFPENMEGIERAPVLHIYTKT